MNKNTSLGRYTQSIKTKEICILLVNDDHICRNIVSDMLDMLDRCRYEVFNYETEMDSMKIIREKKDDLELIMTNVHRTYANNFGIMEQIEKELKLQIILMSPDVDNIKKVSESGGNGVSVYILKSSSVNEVNNLWATAMKKEKEKGKMETSSGKSGVKRKLDIDEENGNVEKKPRIVWSQEMHQKFLEAVDQLGHDKAFPKKIVELMNVPGLTRENVASHLQKYRMCMKRAQEGFTSSSYDFNNSFAFNTIQPNSQESHWNPFRIRSRNTTSDATSTSLFGLNFHESRSRTFPNMPLLNKIQIKPKPISDRIFRVCGDEKKNILLCSNTRFSGFRLAGDGKSIVFGQNSHFHGNCGTTNGSVVNESYVHIQQQNGFCQELRNDDSTLGQEKDDWMSSIVRLLDVDESLPTILSQQPPPPPALPPSGSDRNMNQPSPCVELQWSDWAEPPDFSTQQPPPPPPPPLPGNEVNGSFEIFSDFTPPGLCELLKGIDESGVDATNDIYNFDDLLFDNQDLT